MKTKKISITKRLVIAFIALVFVLEPTQALAIDEDFFSGNNIEYYNPDACTVGDASGEANLRGNDNAEKIWNYFIDQGLTAEQAAGVMGNIQAESGFKSGVEEVGGGGGFGIVQWTGGRRTNLENAAKKKGVSPSSLAFQLEYLYEELNNRPTNLSNYKKFSNEWDMIKGQKTIEDALVAFHHEFEISHLMDKPNPAQAVIEARGKFAKDAYASFSGNKSGGATSKTAGAQKHSVFLDPGHGAAIASFIDTKSGLRTAETANKPESQDALDVANRVKAALEKDGYIVTMARTNNTEKVTFRERADKAATAKAEIGVSIHTTPGEINEAWPQRINTSRSYNGKTDTFGDTAEEKETAKKSEAYANLFATTRSAAEGHAVDTDKGNKTQYDSFHREGISSPGNIPLISLWSPTVPWVYNEIGQDKGTGLSEERKAAYTKGIIDGIKQALPPVAGGECTGEFSGGDINQTLLAYAYPDYHPKPYVTPKKAYKDAFEAAKAAGGYIGGIKYPGIDCGGFVTRLLIDSMYEPKYNYGGLEKDGAGNTIDQEKWMKENWKKIGNGADINAADLKPGDVAINADHTYVYVGKVPGFSKEIASASLDGRAPMAGSEKVTDGDFTWYGKK